MKKLMLIAAAFALLSSPVLAMEAKTALLKDGTKIEIMGDDVAVVGADGSKTPAPDAEHELADGTKVKTMGGKIVHDAAEGAEHAH